MSRPRYLVVVTCDGLLDYESDEFGDATRAMEYARSIVLEKYQGYKNAECFMFPIPSGMTRPIAAWMTEVNASQWLARQRGVRRILSESDSEKRKRA